MGILEAVMLVLVGVAGGTVTALIGGASLITFPALIATGLSPVGAVVVNLIALMPANLSAAWWDRTQMPPFDRSFIWMLVISTVGSLLGAALLMATPDRMFATLVPLLLALSTVLFAFSGRIARWIERNAADPETARGAERLAVETFGRVDILFNNAGVMTSGDFRDFDEAAWDGVLDINLRGIYLMCRAVIPGMLERGRGAIVNTSSVMAFLTEPGYEAYTTSKAGIVGLTKALAVSYATQGIRVNCVLPGWVDTPMNQRLAAELGGIDNLTPIILRQQPNGRMLSTREIGNAVAFLASDAASGITGAALYVDGGASAAI